MAIYGNFKGTTKSDFKIGKNGAKIYGTPVRPTDGMVTGDLWVDSSNSTLQVYDSSNTWVSIGATLQDLNINNGQLAVDTDQGVITANANLVVSQNVNAQNFFGQFIGNVTGTVSSLRNQTTDTLAEGVINEYFTEERAQEALPAVDDVLYINKNGRDVYDGRSEARAFFTVSAAAESIGPPYKANMPAGSEVLPGEFNQAAQLLLANREFIQNEVVAYVIQEESFRYDRAKCERDVGFIIDAVTFDLVLDTNYNSVTAGIAYRRGNATDVITDQVVETVAAFEYLRDLMIGFTTNPDTAARITASIGIITDIIQFNNVPAIIYNNPSTATQDLIAAKDQLQNNRALIQQAVIDFVDTNFTGLQYDEAKCRRDTGFIIDAITYDLVLNTNYNSITSGNAYRRGNAADVIGLQKVPTIGAFEFLRDEMVRISSTEYAQTRIPELFEDLIDIIDTNTVDDIFYTDPSTASQEMINAKNQLQANKLLIQQSVVDYVDQVLGGYGDEKCFRDAGFVIDAITYDMVLDTNYNSITAGLAYRRGNATDVLGVQRANTVAAFTFLRDEMINLTTSIEANLRITDLMQNILDAINLGTTDPLVYVDPATAEQDRIDAKNQLQDNRSFIANAVVQFVNENFTYDAAKCERDVGFIIDAVIYDMVLDTNYNSITAGLAYRGANAADVLGPQKTATINSFLFLQDLMIALTDTPAAAQRITEAFQDIIDIIDTNTVDTLRLTNPAGVGQDFIDAKDQLQNNRELIQNAVVDFVNLQFSYDREKCFRDVGFIIDAVTYDMVLDTNYNSVTAGLAYLGGNATDVLTFQQQPTIDAFNFLRDQMIAVTSSPAAAARITDLIQDVTDAIDTQTIDTIFYNVPLTATDAEVNAHIQLRNNRELIANAVVEFVNENFTYDVAKCFRDVGFIIDAVTFDMVLDTNYNSITAGLSYRGGNATDVLGPQREATIAAFEFLRDQMNLLAVDAGVQATITARIQDITDIIDTNTVDPIVFNDPSTATVNEVNAKNQLQNNRDLIANTVVQFVNDNFTYDEAKCFRDAGFVYDAVIYDMVLNTNYNSVTAGIIYRGGNATDVIGPQREATIGAFEFLRDEMLTIAANTTSDARITAAFTDIIDAIDTNTIDTIVFNNPSTATVEEIAAKDQLQNNRALIQANVVNFVDVNFPTLTYDANACSRDVGFIVDALTHDILYDGNFASRQAAIAYFDGVASQLGSQDEVNATIAAYTYLQGVVANVVQETFPGQDTSADAATLVEANRLSDLLQITIDVLVDGSTINLAPLSVPDLNASSVPIQTDFSSLQSEKANLQQATVDQVNATSNFVNGYDPDLCLRDVGYIVDALTFDVLYGGNFASRQAAAIYFNATQPGLGVGEANATIAAYNELQNIVSNVVLETYPGQDTSADPASAAEVSFLNARIQIVIDTIADGNTDNLPAQVNPDISAGSIQEQTDYLAITAERANLQQATVDFIGSDGFDFINGYDANLCLRDTGYIIDALSHDILYDGNFASRQAAQIYFTQTIFGLENELDRRNENNATIAAFIELGNIAASVVLGTYPGQNVSAGFATINEATQLQNLAGITSDALLEGDPEQIVELEAPDLLAGNVELRNDYANIIAIKGDLQTATVANVDSSNSFLVYNQDLCFRDTGYVIDALSHDVLYGGNYASLQVAGIYFAGAVNQLGSNAETNATIAAYNFLSNVASNVIVGTFPGQDQSAGNASIVQQNIVDNLIQITVDVLISGDGNTLPAVVEPTVSVAPANLQADFGNIQSVKGDLQTQTIQFVDTQTDRINGYDSNACLRDVGFIVDGLTHDILYGGNFASRLVADAYFVGTLSQIGPTEGTATVAAYQELQRLTGNVVRGLEPGQILTSNTATIVEAAELASLLQITIDVIEQGTVEVIPQLEAPNISIANATLLSDYGNIVVERANLQQGVIDQVNSNSSIFPYDSTDCFRDVGFIVDALTHDILYDGNFANRQVADAYFVGAASQLGSPEEVNATIQAYQEMQRIVANVVQGAFPGQDQTFGNATIVEANELGNLLQITIDTITAGNVSAIPALEEPNVSAANAAVQSDRSNILAQSNVLTDGVILFVDDNFVEFTYDQDKCFRDVGFIVDAVTLDMVLDTNYNSVTAGNAYRRGNASDVIGSQQPQTIQAYEFLRDTMNSLTTSETAQLRINAAFEDIIDIISDDNIVDTIYYNAAPGMAPEVVNAQRQLRNNRELIQNAVIDFVNSNFTYNQDKCRRDVGFIIDAVIYDMVTNSNYNSVTAGLSYLGGNARDVLQFQRPETVAAFNNLRDLMVGIAEDETAQARIIDLFQDITDVLETGTVDTIRFNNPPSTQQDIIDAKNQLQDNRAIIQQAVVDFVNQNFSYDEAKCFRDTGFIIDAVLYDMVLETNHNVLAAGKAYRGGNATLVIDTQRTQTIAAFNFLRDQMISFTTNPVSAARITSLFEDLNNIIDSNTVADLFFDSPAGASQDVIDAKNLLQDNRDIIQQAVVDFVNDNFSYDETKCRRDTNFVIDAVLFDMVLDTNYNSVTAGLAYQRGNATDVLGFQNETTIEAFTFLRDQMLTFAQNDDANIRITAAFDDILDSLSTNTIDTIFYNDPPTADANVINAKNQLQNNRDLIANTVVQFVNDNFTYDEAKCFRDVGFIIDAVLYDMVLNTNYNSVTAGLLYNGGNATDVLGPQKAATIAAFEFLRDEMIAIANDPQADARITAAFVDIIDAIDTNTIDAIIYNVPAGVDQDRVDALEQLQNNRALIQANVVNFVDTNFANLSYDANACSRDVGYIVDALSHDILYDGNFASRQVATAYFVGTQNQLGNINEIPATIAAYEYLQGVVANIVLETFPGQDTSAGIASSALASDLGNLIQISVDVLTAGTLNPLAPLEQPNIAIANATLQSDFANINLVKGNLQQSTVDFVNAESFFINDYDQDLCLRDVGFIVDGLTHDILYGGNYASRLLADAYFVGVTSQLGMGESTATIAAYGELQNVISSVVVETFPGQDTSANAATTDEANVLSNLLQITIDLIASNNTTALPALVEPDTTFAAVPLQNTRILVDAERANLVNSVINVVEANASFLIYDSNACFRDVGFIVDAMSHDILYDGNFATRQAGIAYYVGNDLQIGGREVNATIAAYQELGRVASNVILTTYPGQRINFNPGTQTEADRAVTLSGIIADVIDNGEPANVVLVEPDITVGRPIEIQQDFANIQVQKGNLQTATVGFVNDTFDFISYDANLCFRDVGYIVDAATYDLLYTGNYASRLAANSYFVASVNQLGDGETNATIAAYQELQSITSQVVQGIYPGQILDSQVATSVEADRVNALIQVTIDVLQDGSDANLAFLEEPNVLISGLSIRSDLQSIQAQRSTLQNTTLNFVDNNFKFIEYDEALCFRDVGFIVDSLAHDIQYGGTFAQTQVAFSYFVGVNDSQLGPDEVNATVAAYTELGTIAGQVVQGIYPGQDLSAGVATPDQANAIVDLLSITIDTIAAGTTDVIPFPPTFPDITIANAELQTAFAEIAPEKANLQQQTITFINDLYGGFSYNQDLCFRDVGFIVDGLSHDVLYGGNFAARLIADSYFVGVTSQLGSVGEIDATVAAYQELQRITANVVTENYPGQNVAANAATINEANVIADLLQITIDVIQDGNTSSIPVLVSPDITAANLDIQNDYGNVVAERGNLQIEIIDFVDQTYPRLMTDRQTNLCFRDTGFIVDALAEDLVRGGNQFSSACGVAYFNGAASRLPADQIAPTQNAISLIATIAADAMYNVPIANTYQTEVSQVFDDGILPEPGANVNVDILVAGINETIVNPTLSRGAVIKNNIAIEGELNPGAYENTATLLDLNKEFIQAEARAFGNINYGGSLGEDNLDKTFRDTGFIIDAVVEDLRKGGARRTSFVATEFWDTESKPKIRPEIQANCVAILNFVNTVAGSVIENSLRIPLQNDIPQIIDGALPFEPGSDVVMTALIDSVPRTIQNPKVAAQKQVVSNFNGLAANNPGNFDNAAQLLLANRAFIQEEVIARTNATERFQYDRNKCSRDVGLIIQAVALDLALGTNYNSVTAGIAYLRAASAYVRSAQFTQTIRAIEFVRDYITENLAIDDLTKDVVRQRFEDLLDIVQERLFDNLFFEQPDNAGEDRISAAFLLQKNRDFMQTEVMNFIAREYTGLRFDERTCRRDVGFIVDGLVHDVLYGGNYASRIVADSYYNGTMAQIGRQEFPATIDSYWFLRDMANRVILGTYTGQQMLESRQVGSQAEVDRITELLQITIDVIRLRGTDSIPDVELPDLTWNNEPFLSDYATIIAATPVIQNQTLVFVDNNLGSLVYNQDLCKRDVGHIVDALVEDLQTGGYEECKIAALDYYTGAASVLPQDQLLPTTNAISYIATLASDIVFNQTVANTFQSNVSQIIDTEFQGEPDSADNIAFLIGGINDTIREAKPRRVVLMVQAGDYTVENPVKLPPNTAVWGNGIRTTSIRPRRINQDIFYVDNGCYIAEMTLRDHIDPSAAVAFDPTLRDTLRPIIETSPYIQNATSRTTTGTGLRIDGAAVRGDIRSMVCDSYTQFNEGGIGVRILNQGYAQLVSVFTICCNDGFVCESGAVTSITNSNSSFGTRALRATGTSPMLYAGELGETVNTGKNIIIRNLPQRPNVSDAVLIDGANAYFTVFNTTQIDETTWNVRLIESIVNAEFPEGARVRFYQRSLIVASSHTFEFVGSGDILRDALPSFGGVPNPAGEGVFDENNAGKVFYTSTNENGDFSVSGEFVINQNTGTVTGRTFDKSLFAVLTPYILALQN